MPVPANPKIYHIVHIDNLASIVADGHLWPDSVMAKRRGAAVIGNHEIKSDRLRLPVACHPETCVGDYVPFYLCPRSVMLYVISKQNHPNVAFHHGQGPVVHLVADMKEVVAWADAEKRKWAFSDINAANRLADFHDDLEQLDQLNWDAIGTRNWVSCRDHKMAEFLLHGGFPWSLFRGIGVYSHGMATRVGEVLQGAANRPKVEIKTEWYY